MTRNKGFTLIELMFTIGLLGILIVISIPFYQDYTIRARVVEGLQLATSAKLAVSEIAVTNNALPATQATTGYVSPAATPNVTSITIADTTGIITVTYAATAGGGTMLLVPTLQASGEVSWACGQGTLLSKYRPASCR